MLDNILLKQTKPILSKLASIAIKVGVSANTASIIGFIFGITSACLVGFGYFFLALISFIINRIFDGLDGTIARKQHPTYRGAFLDIVFDFIIYSSIPFAFAIYNKEYSFVACFLIFSFIGTGTSFLTYGIIHAQIQKKNEETDAEKSFFYLGGLIEGSETLFFIIFILLFPSLFTHIGILFGCLCWITTIFRIRAGWRDFSLK